MEIGQSPASPASGHTQPNADSQVSRREEKIRQEHNAEQVTAENRPAPSGSRGQYIDTYV